MQASENKAPKNLVLEEARKAMSAEGINVTKFGMISSSGFEEKVEGIVLIDGDELYGKTDL